VLTAGSNSFFLFVWGDEESWKANGQSFLRYITELFTEEIFCAANMIRSV
jgi:hypothetical protein